MYMSWQPLFDNLSDEDAGQMINAIYKYQMTEELPDTYWHLYPTFMMLKATMDEDNAKYKAKVNRVNSINQNRNDIDTTSEQNRDDIGGVTSDTDTVTDTVNLIEAVEEVIDYLNTTCDKHYRAKNKKTIEHINGRLNEGFTVDDLKRVIDNKARKWKGDKKMDDYLRPSTLFAPKKFEEYLNERPSESTQHMDFSDIDSW